MKRMPVMCADSEINNRIERICRKFGNYFEPVFLTDAVEALEYLKYELPEISVIHYSDKQLDARSVLRTIQSDPWLHYGGIIAVHARQDAEEVVNEVPDSSIIAMISRGEFVSGFFRVLRIVIQNRQILFQRDIQAFLITNVSGSFVMDNDPFNVRAYANIVANFLYNLNYTDRDGKDRIHVALFEILMNAVEHGNCAITFDEKNQWLRKHGDILNLIRRKNEDPIVKRRRVFFTYRITPERSFFTVRDEGAGFDWRTRMRQQHSDTRLSLHGRGIQLAEIYAENLSYNDTGNEVSFEFTHAQNESNVVPEAFRSEQEVTFGDRGIVFREGEESNFLYYIVSGRLKVYAGGQYLSTLTPADIFLGEMSFLLSNRRSATVLSDGQSVLIRISKNAFVNVIKDKPHYGIFLARLLAQRLSRLNTQFAAISS